MQTRLLLALGAWLLVACGGKADEDDMADPAPRAADPETAAGVSGLDGGEEPRDGLWNGVPLPDCKLGKRWEVTPERECAFVADDRCYASKDAACACLCPRDANSFCVTGFTSPGELKVKTTCVRRD